MSTKVLELKKALAQDDPASFISTTWDTLNNQRAEKLAQWLELRNYIFATDTSTTTNSSLPWKNSTTTPKLCQIRDNLHSNYMSALFPNDSWVSWEAYDDAAAQKDKKKAITTYIANKCREGRFRTEVSKLVYDYIDYGNAFAAPLFESSYKELANGDKLPGFIGPRAVRISPLDIVFNPMASDLQHSYKIIRSVKTLGEVEKLATSEGDQSFWKDALAHRKNITDMLGRGYSYEDFQKACGYSADGFGNMQEYFMGNQMEILEFYGDYYDPSNGELSLNRVITVVDRSKVVRNEEQPSWFGYAPVYHVGWRFRPDNLWSMGPLDNLVGMQYRIDHLENLKADAMDLIVQPPLKIRGDVEEFEWGPMAEIHLDEGGDVEVLTRDMNAIIVADNQISELEEKMELYAGAPKQAMGIRTPGEKTAFEVQTLENAAGRIFQEKAVNFEIELLEPLLNGMLETAVRNMSGLDVIRSVDKDIGVEEFLEITRDDIVANGKLRPVGARHFAKQAQDLQNLVGVMNSPLINFVSPHTSGKNLTAFINDLIGLKAYDIFRPNVGVEEQAETQAYVNNLNNDLQEQQAVGLPDDM